MKLRRLRILFLLCLVVAFLGILIGVLYIFSMCTFFVATMFTSSSSNDCSNESFEIRILSVRGGLYGDFPVRRIFDSALPKARLIFTEDTSFDEEIHLIIEGPPSLRHLSECGPEDLPWAQYIGEPGKLYDDDAWCKHTDQPIFRVDTSLKYRARTHAHTNFIWSPYASVVTEEFLAQKILEKRRRADEWRERPYFLAWIASNCDSETRNFALTQLLEVARERNIGDFHSLGGCMPNTNISIPSRSSGWPAVIDIYKKYRFVVSFENSIEPGYVSEKLVTALAGGAVPVYYGDGDAAHLIFPDLDFIDVRDIWSITGGKYAAEQSSPVNWRDIFEYLIGLDNGTYCMDECTKPIFKHPTSWSHAAHKLVPFPSQALDMKTVKELSRKLSKSFGCAK